MEHEKYVFEIGPMNTEALLPQVSYALEKRTELVSRKACPNIWEHTDRLSAKNGAPAALSRRSRARTKALSLICLALGIFLFVPGLTDPQGLLVPLLAGAVGIGSGIGGLWRSRKNKKGPFERSAEALLAGKNTDAEKGFHASFSQDGMTLSDSQADHDDAYEEFIPYDDFECAVETDDVLLVTSNDRVILLHKRDLVTGDIAGLRKLLSERTPLSSMAEEQIASA